MNKNQKLVIVCMVAIFAVLIIAIGLLSGRQREPEVAEFVPPSFEQTAVVGIPENLDPALNYQSFTVEEKLFVGMCGNLVLKEDNTVDIYFTLDSKNTCLAKVKLLDEKGNVLGESGLLRSGQYVPMVELSDPPKNSCPIIAKILTYEEDTYYSEGTVSAQLVLNVE